MALLKGQRTHTQQEHRPNQSEFMTSRMDANFPTHATTGYVTNIKKNMMTR